MNFLYKRRQKRPTKWELSQSVLTEVNGWLGEGGKATLTTAPNADIMREVLCTLRTGGSTFLVKVKSYDYDTPGTRRKEGREGSL